MKLLGEKKMYRRKWDNRHETTDTLQGEIDRLRELMYSAVSKTGSFTHHMVVEISQVIDERVLEYQRLKIESVQTNEMI